MLDQICRDLCKPHFSLGTWLASATVSFLCLGPLVSVRLCSLYVTYTAQSSASRVRWLVVYVKKRCSGAPFEESAFYTIHRFWLVSVDKMDQIGCGKHAPPCVCDSILDDNVV
ncbi:unnamed protein product [Ilex paraguariensis]|uniref:Secreted protein n=1 Tax=Ilex paraguariensis TaxID=185542 RepID=A0ABC8R348_9AQUA